MAVWIVIWWFTEGNDTLALPGVARTELHDRLTEWQNDLLASRDTNPVMQFTNAIAEALRNAVDWLQRMIVSPTSPVRCPEIGWFGVVALATYVGVGGRQLADRPAGAGLVPLLRRLRLLAGLARPADHHRHLGGAGGAHRDAAGGAIGTRARANQIVTPVLDLMQTMPTFVYLLPIVLFFGIGASAAVVSTLIYALPPIIRIAGFGIREVSKTTIEATDSAGQTYWQRLTKVQLPMARKTIIVGLNQTTLAALSMATLAAFVDGPGLGKPVLAGLRINDVGTAFVPGALIVVMAVMLDRTTTAASERAEKVARGGGGNPGCAAHPDRRRCGDPRGDLPLAHLQGLAEFPVYSIGDKVATAVSDAIDWFTDTFGDVTEASRTR